MIIEQIALTNLFSYYGVQRFDLGRPEPGRNICLILGRNGVGKTKLLNSLKLLFTGARNEPLRRSIQRRRMPTVKQYVLGVGEDWWGIMNRHARAEGQTRCAVELVWTENEQRVTAERSWIIEGDDWDTEQLQVRTGETRLEDQAAQDFLDRRLPPDYVDFFFFDGEQIQELAEANREVQQHQMERILGIGAIDALREALRRANAVWQRSDLKPEAKAELEREEGNLAAISEELARLDDEQTLLEQEIEDESATLARLNRRIEGISAYVHRHDEAELRQQRKRLEGDYADSREQLSKDLPRDVVLLANPKLVARAIERLDRVLNSDDATRRRVLDALAEDLPARLFDRPDHPRPDINGVQKAFYSYKLMDMLQQFRDADSRGTDADFAPDPQAASTAREQLSAYAEADGLRSARADALGRLQTLAAQLRKLDEDLLSVGSLSEEERQQYERHVAHRDEIARGLADKQQRVGSIQEKRSERQRSHEKVHKRIRAIKQSLTTNEITEEKIRLARQLGDLFSAVKDRRKAEQRQGLESAINKHFRVLMTSHRLIDYVRVDDDFALHYLDHDRKPVGMGSIASGMKQLMATALLWSLSEVSGKLVPVVIDTPLARIDAGHQEGILKHYYPNAAAQVIVLPTDTEIDERKLALVAPHVYAAFRLTNLDGEHTKPVRVQTSELLAGG